MRGRSVIADDTTKPWPERKGGSPAHPVEGVGVEHDDAEEEVVEELLAVSEKAEEENEGGQHREREPEDERVHDGKQRKHWGAAPGARNDACKPHAEGRRRRAAEGECHVAEGNQG